MRTVSATAEITNPSGVTAAAITTALQGAEADPERIGAEYLPDALTLATGDPNTGESLIVTGVAGVLTSNGIATLVFPTLYQSGVASGKVRYTNVASGLGVITHKIEWSTVSAKWQIFNGATVVFESSNNVVSPDLVTTWAAVSPATGTPSVASDSMVVTTLGQSLQVLDTGAWYKWDGEVWELEAANLTAGPVRSTAGTSSIADGALSIAKTSGLQAALDLKQPRTQIKRLAVVGDSITNYTSTAIGTFPTSNGINQRAFGYGDSIQICANHSLELVRDAGLLGSASGGQDLDFGHSGQGTAVIRSGVLADALATDADAIFIMAGTNDTAGASTAAEIMTLIEGCWTDIIAAGKIPIAATIIPRRDDVPINTKTHAVNALMRSRATALGVDLCDWAHIVQTPGAVVGAAGLGVTQFYDDGTHPNMWGGIRMGKYAADFIAANFQTTPFERPRTYITRNPIGRGVTGLNSNLPTGWEKSADQVGSTVTVSVVPRTDGHPGNWTQLVISGAPTPTTDSMYTQIFIRTSGTSLAGYNVGDGFRAFVEIVDVSNTFHLVSIDVQNVGVGTLDKVRSPENGWATLSTTDYPNQSGYYVSALNEVKASATGFLLAIKIYGNGTLRIGEAGIYPTWR
jgi:lysophospholipase L1-like esterase